MADKRAALQFSGRDEDARRRGRGFNTKRGEGVAHFSIADGFPRPSRIKDQETA